MGMFDWVRCNAPLPPHRKTKSAEFQTKDLDCQMDHIHISAEGRLLSVSFDYDTREWGTPKDLNHHGYLDFYDLPANEGEAMVEFRAKFTDGQLVEIVAVNP
jgi:hypothetical protein